MWKVSTVSFPTEWEGNRVTRGICVLCLANEKAETLGCIAPNLSPCAPTNVAASMLEDPRLAKVWLILLKPWAT